MDKSDKTSDTFDLVVIGAGSGGLAAAKRAAAHGARVAVVEGSRVGGTCVIRGCVPKKLMIYAAQLGQLRQLASHYGWRDTLGDLDFEQLVSRRNQAVLGLEKMHEQRLVEANVTLLRGWAAVVGRGKVAVGERLLHSDKILLATGARPGGLSVDVTPKVISSDQFWDLKSVPRHVLVYGGGYIATELASILSGLGAKVSLAVRSRLLRSFDRSVGEHLTKCLSSNGIGIHEGVGAEQLPSLIGKLSPSCDLVLVATGRYPNTDRLRLSEVGVELTDTGAVRVDEHHCTAATGIYAVGDITGREMLTPVAIKAGRTWADRVFGGAASAPPMSYDNVPSAVFSLPPAASVGLSEEKARQRYGEAIEVNFSRFGPMLYSFLPREQRPQTMMKLVTRQSDGRVLGCHMVGDDAPEIIQGFAAAITAGVTREDLSRTIAIHPSAAEEFVLM